MGVMGATKKVKSERKIEINNALVSLLKLVPSPPLELPNVFVGMREMPMTKKWAEHFWKGPLKKLGIRHRKFYCTPTHFHHGAINRGKTSWRWRSTTGLQW